MNQTLPFSDPCVKYDGNNKCLECGTTNTFLQQKGYILIDG